MLGLSAIVGLLIAIWSASRGMSGTITALNIAYEEKEGRGFIKLNLVAVALTLIFMVGGLLVIALIAGAPAAVELVSAAAANKWLVLVLEWPLLIIVVMVGLAVLYSIRAGPSQAAMALGLARGDCCNDLMGRGFCWLHYLRCQFQQLRQNIRIPRRRGHSPDLALSVSTHGLVRGCDQRAVRETNAKGLDRWATSADGRTPSASGRRSRAEQGLTKRNQAHAWQRAT